MTRIVLASASPRRLELLKQVGIEAEVMASDVAENLHQDVTPGMLAERLAVLKASIVADTISDGIIIGADTVVVVNGMVLGKPLDEPQAIEMLTLLSGREHQVITGLAVIQKPAGEIVALHEETIVRFRSLSEAEIFGYVRTGEPYDKAGGYGIQGKGALLVDRIYGDYFNVVGLPLNRLNILLSKWNINLLINSGE